MQSAVHCLPHPTLHRDPHLSRSLSSGARFARPGGDIFSQREKNALSGHHDE
jgi:hypothetical protein